MTAFLYRFPTVEKQDLSRCLREGYHCDYIPNMLLPPPPNLLTVETQGYHHTKGRRKRREAGSLSRDCNFSLPPPTDGRTGGGRAREITLFIIKRKYSRKEEDKAHMTMFRLFCPLRV